MSTYLPESLRLQIETADRQRCCYCLTSEANSGIPMIYDHIQPLSKGGDTSFENLCLACRSCNEFKENLTQAIDPVTVELVPLFHPRRQQWSEHFVWSADGTRIKQNVERSPQPESLIWLGCVQGLTVIGRATVVALRMNHPVIIGAPRRWVSSGWHPPIVI